VCVYVCVLQHTNNKKEFSMNDYGFRKAHMPKVKRVLGGVSLMHKLLVHINKRQQAVLSDLLFIIQEK
jgi:hypothetical protein